MPHTCTSALYDEDRSKQMFLVFWWSFLLYLLYSSYKLPLCDLSIMSSVHCYQNNHVIHKVSWTEVAQVIIFHSVVYTATSFAQPCSLDTKAQCSKQQLSHLMIWFLHLPVLSLTCRLVLQQELLINITGLVRPTRTVFNLLWDVH